MLRGLVRPRAARSSILLTSYRSACWEKIAVIREKENRPEAADHVRSKTRNQHWIDFLRTTG